MTDAKARVALQAALTAMFQDVEAQGVPAHLRDLADELDRSEETIPAAERRRA